MNPITIIFLILIVLILFLIVLNKIANVEIGGWKLKVGPYEVKIPSTKPFYFLRTWFIEPVEKTVKGVFNYINNLILGFSHEIASYGVPLELANALAFTIIFTLTLAILYIPYKLIGG